MALISSLNSLTRLLTSLFISCSLRPFHSLVFYFNFFILHPRVCCLIFDFFSNFSLIFYSLYLLLVFPLPYPVCFIYFVHISLLHFNCYVIT